MADREALLENLTRCTRCPDMCLFACPVFSASHNQAYAPSHLAHVARMLEQGQLEPDPQVVETLYRCIHCRMCQAWCIYDDIDLQDLLCEVRGSLVESHPGLQLPEYVEEARRSYLQTGSPWGQLSGEAFAELAACGQEQGEVLYFAGCAARMLQPEIAVAAMRLLSALGIQAAFEPREEPCCGGALLDMGLRVEAAKAKEAARAYIKASGCNTVVSGCSRCVQSLRDCLEQVDASPDIRVMHIAEYLVATLGGEGANGTIFERTPALVEDPFLVRALGITDVLPGYLAERWGIKIVELPDHGRTARPAGAYYGLPDLDLAGAITRRFLGRVRSLGVDALITTSPWDKRALLAHANGEWVVQDLVEVLAVITGQG